LAAPNKRVTTSRDENGVPDARIERRRMGRAEADSREKFCDGLWRATLESDALFEMRNCQRRALLADEWETPRLPRPIIPSIKITTVLSQAAASLLRWLVFSKIMAAPLFRLSADCFHASAIRMPFRHETVCNGSIVSDCRLLGRTNVSGIILLSLISFSTIFHLMRARALSNSKYHGSRQVCDLLGLVLADSDLRALFILAYLSILQSWIFNLYTRFFLFVYADKIFETFQLNTH